MAVSAMPYDVAVVGVDVDGTLLSPVLSLSSDPPVSQSDILSLLLFGKTTTELTGGEGDRLQSQAIGLLASYVAPELQQSLMDTFGLSSVSLSAPSETSAGSVSVGRYITPDLFVLPEQFADDLPPFDSGDRIGREPARS